MENTMKYLLMILVVGIISITIISSFQYSLAADNVDPEKYNPNNNQLNLKELTDKAGIVLGVVRNVSVVVSVITLMIIGVKYILGSVEEKANYKETMVPYVIGAVMAVAGTTLVSFIYNAVHD